jgi:hypothetical protein
MLEFVRRVYKTPRSLGRGAGFKWWQALPAHG